MSLNPYESPQTAETPQAPTTGRRRGFRLLELLAVVAVIGLLVACLLPVSRTAREPARRMQCGNNLKQIGIALVMYEEEYGSLPPAYTVGADGKPLHSWRTLILPFAEQKSLYDKIDLAKPWDDPANRLAYEADIPMYQCPSSVIPKRHTTYLAVVTRGGCFQPTKPRPLAEITDEHEQTLMVIEVPPSQAVHWMSPSDAAEDLVLNAVGAEKLAHPSGTQAALVDGSVRFLSAKTKPEILRALISIAGKDVAKIDD
jgi:prepilin-type N-terminal cleavage/methylation domain-containing protein